MERLQKYLARCGIASRRSAEELIRAQRVMVNGQVVAQPGIKIDPDHDEITFDGQVIKPEEHWYLLLNKPRGYLSTLWDPKAGPSLTPLLKDIPVRVYPAGRLDQESEGLLFLTNDGQLSYQLTHPKFKIPKTYQVRFKGEMSETTIEQLGKGVRLKDGLTQPAKVRLIERKEKTTLLEMTIYEGKKRQIRRMGEAVGHPVLELIRTKIGPFEIGDLKPGEYRILTEQEIKRFYHEYLYG